MPEIKNSELDQILARCGRGEHAVIPVLQAVQGLYNYLPEQALRYICDHSEITPAAIIGVSSFYSQFRHEPAGKHMISVCVGTACHVKGAERVYNAFRRQMHLDDDGAGDTDAEGVFTIRQVSCLGCCTLAPVVQIDGVTYGHVTTSTVAEVMDDFLTREATRTSDSDKDGPGPESAVGEIRVGLGSCCVASGSGELESVLRKTVKSMKAPVRIKRVGCVGMCHRTPLLEVQPDDNPNSILYSKVKPDDVPSILERHFRPGNWLTHLKSQVVRSLVHIYTDASWTPVNRYALNVRDPSVHAFLDPQKHLATEYYGHIDPVDLDEYRRCEGFEALRRVVHQMKPAEVIAKIEASGMRGRGGAGFPSGRKWRHVAAADGYPKYVVCNGDEGDPGAFMDRMLLESYPYRVIEGVCVAAYAVGAEEGILYVRAEYPLALQRLRNALTRCRDAGLLGRDILGSNFSFDLSIMEGAGAFVCGEETALIASIEGRRGMPRLRPPYPAQHGLRGQPTLVNNTETFALVPWIMRNGAEAFATIGTQQSKGTKVFALAGKVARGGLIEVPMGITIRQIIDDIGGGITGGKKLKAVQVGGPSGGCIPAWLDQTPIDYEALVQVGAMMGSGGLVVLDESDCMVDIARYFLSFTQHESCGKCTFCRVGTKRMLEILESLCEGNGQEKDIEELEHLAHVIKQGSLCGLGKTAPNPVLTTLKYFRDEYEAHVNGICPAGKCKALVSYTVTDECIGCTICAQQCPADAIDARPYEKHQIDDAACIRCDTCRQVCPADAINVITKTDGAKEKI